MRISMKTFTIASALAGALSLSSAASAEEEAAPPAPAEHAQEAEKAEPAHEGDKAEPAAHHGLTPEAAPEGTHTAEHAEHEEHEEGIVNWWSWDKSLPPPFGWALVNFAIFLGILSRIVWKPIKAGIVDRHDRIKHELGEATRLRQAAEAQLAEYTKKVANAESEVNALLTQLRKDADADRARILAAAEADATRLKEEADRQIKVEIERARLELRRETVEAALKAAEDLLKRGVNDADQQKLAERYLGDVERIAPRRTEQRS